MRGAHGHSLGGRVAWAVAGLLSAGGHWAEEWELLKYPHTGAHMFTHTGAHPGTQYPGLHPPVHGTESRRHVCMFTHRCAHAKSQKCLHRSRRPSQGLPCSCCPSSCRRGQWSLGSPWAGATGGGARLGGLLRAAEAPPPPADAQSVPAGAQDVAAPVTRGRRTARSLEHTRTRICLNLLTAWLWGSYSASLSLFHHLYSGGCHGSCGFCVEQRRECTVDSVANSLSPVPLGGAEPTQCSGRAVPSHRFQ